MRSAPRYSLVEPYAGEFEGRCALVGFPDGLRLKSRGGSLRMCFSQDSASRRGVPPLNGGSGGRYPQIRVLPPQITSATHKFSSLNTPLITSIYPRSPTRPLEFVGALSFGVTHPTMWAIIFLLFPSATPPPQPPQSAPSKTITKSSPHLSKSTNASKLASDHPNSHLPAPPPTPEP